MQNRSIPLPFIPKEELNGVLHIFYEEVKTLKKISLAPSALADVRAALHRHLMTRLTSIEI